jgi:hypothetical protein
MNFKAKTLIKFLVLPITIASIVGASTALIAASKSKLPVDESITIYGSSTPEGQVGDGGGSVVYSAVTNIGKDITNSAT